MKEKESGIRKNDKKRKKRISLISIIWIIFFILLIFTIFLILYGIHKKNVQNEITSIDSSIPIPEGFYFVGGTKSTGFVISDEKSDYKKGTSHESATKLKGNQFVWVPVENPIANDEIELKDMINEGKFPMALKNENGYQGIFYTFDSFDKKYYPILDNMEISEPEILSDKLYGDSEEMLKGCTDLLYQDAYNNMIKSVEKYKGFYISRYEAGNLTESINSNVKVVSKNGQTDISSNTWFNMYKSIREMYDRDDITTEMIWGSQWDSTLRWLSDSNDNFYNLNYNNGNFSGEKKSTGSDEKYSFNNIYDMYGNVSEWTQSGARGASRMSRGANYSEKKSIDSMQYSGVTYLYEYLGTRIVLYINE